MNSKPINFFYIFSHSDSTKFEIPHFYDKYVWKIGETYRMRISNAYDPSKFWIVLKEQELAIFHEYMLNFYKQYGDRYKMSRCTILRNTYCVAFTDNAYYRGIIVDIPQNLGAEEKAIVFLIDFGFTCVMDFENLHHLSEKLFKVPRFAVRASLTGVQPFHKDTWDDEAVKKFNDLVCKKLLLCILDCTDPTRKIVNITIGSLDEFPSVTDIGSVLINEKLAISTSAKKTAKKIDKNIQYRPITKYPHLFPSFEAIENGAVPSSVFESELLKQCVPYDLLYSPYFAYKPTSED